MKANTRILTFALLFSIATSAAPYTLDVLPAEHKIIQDEGSGATLTFLTTDRADDTRGVDVFSLRWRDAAAAGFCVLPAERFLLGH